MSDGGPTPETPAGEGADWLPPSEPNPAPQTRQRGRLAWILAVVGLLIIVGGIAFFALSGDDSDDAASDGTGATTDEPKATPEQITKGQEALAAVGCYAGPIDGKYGPMTDQAIRDFQSASGLVVDSIFGPATLAALEKAVAAGEVVCTPATAPPTEPILEDAPSPDGGTVKRLVVPGPETSVILVCDQDGFQAFFFTDRGDWVGCEAVTGTDPGPESDLTEPKLSEVEGPAGGMVKELTIPGPQSSVLVACAGSDFEPFLFEDQGTWIGCQSR